LIINNINIVAFGKLKNFHIDFNQGLNVIYGDVENGQATIMAFIKMAFYGSQSIDSKSDPLTNERLKYRPYDDLDAQMGGSIDFSFNDKCYRIDRIFKNSNATDEISLYNLSDNVQLDIGDEHEIGKMFLGMSADSFERSIFINQINGTIADEKSTQKLINIISSYDENTSAELIKARLNTAKETYLSKSGKIGILDKSKANLSSLYDDIHSAQAEESQKLQMQIEYEAVQDNRDEIISRYDELRRTLNIQQTMTEVNALKNTVSKLDHIKDLENEVLARKQALSNENITVNDEFIKTAQQKMNTIQQIGEMKNQYQSNVYKVKTDLETMTETLNSSYTEERQLFNEAIEQIEFTNGHIKNLDDALTAKKKELEQLSEKIKDADVNFRVVDEQVKAKKELSQQRLDMAQQQLTDARQPRVYDNTNTSGKTFIALAIVIVILGVLLTLTVQPIFIIVICIGLIIALATFLDKNTSNNKNMKNYNRIDEVAVSKANENIQKIRHDIEMEQYSLNKKQREAKKQLNLLTLNEEQLLADCEKYTDQKETLKKNLEYWENQKRETEAIFSAEQSKVDKKQDELSTLLENIAISEEDFYNAQNDIFTYIGKFKVCSTLTEVSDLISELSNELDNIKNIENKIDYQSEIIKSETNGQSYDELKEKLTDVTADFIEMCGKENPEAMSISELSKLKAEIDDCQFSLNMQNADLSYINTDIRAKFRNRTCVTEIEHNINHLEREIVKQEKFCHSLDLASEVLQQSIDELNEHSSALNEKTSMIFNQLADGSYESLAIAQTLDISTKNDASLNTWRYLSKGTIEQAYLSLRLGVSQMISDISFANSLPILLDDFFIQYDNDRVLKDINFIYKYSNASQVIMFTCHKNIFDAIQENNIPAMLIALV